MSDVSLSDIHKIKKILRDNGLHERECGHNHIAFDAVMGMNVKSPQPCDCYLAKDLWDMEADPPMRVEIMDNIAETVRGHIYDDGRRRAWRLDKHSGGGWKEMPW